MSQYDFRLTRVFVTADLTMDGAFAASDAQANHLLRVLRKREGDSVHLFNGRDGEWLANVVSVSKRSCSLLPLRQVRAQTPASDVLCCFAPLKKARMDYVVQKAVEMGAGRLQPVFTERTQVERVKLERMEVNVVEAAEQCGVLSVPDVAAPIALAAFLEQWDKTRTLIFCDEAAQPGDPVAALRSIERSCCGLLVGPEGGFSDDERAILSALPFVVRISLGPRILRADTALVAALAVVQTAMGDWR